jgi:hypothetical protein
MCSPIDEAPGPMKIEWRIVELITAVTLTAIVVAWLVT